MPLLRHLLAGVRSILRRDEADRDLDDEVRHYLAMAAADKVRNGVPLEDAERQARVEFGGVDVAKETVRGGAWEIAVESVARDLRGALRHLRASPSFSLVAIGTIGIGMALTTTVLTVANTVLTQRWPVREPDRVLTVVNRNGVMDMSPAEARFIGARATTVAAVVSERCLEGLIEQCRLKLDDDSATVDFVSGNFFSALGVGIQIGRPLLPSDDQLDAPSAVAVLSDATWRSRFGGDSTIVGKQIRIDDAAFTVVGVASPRFTGTRAERKDAWLPIAAASIVRPRQPAMMQLLSAASAEVSRAAVAVRLKQDVSAEQARAELTALDREFRDENRLENRGLRLVATSLFPNPSKLRTARGMFALIFTATLLVLLLACANVANLLLARASARRREIAVRLALGASRGRVVRQLLTESLLLAVASGSIGLIVALRAPSILIARTIGPMSWTFAPDARVVAVTLGLVLLTCIAFGLAPALHASREDVASVLKAGAGRASSGRRLTPRGGLLSTQIAISLILLANAGMLMRGIRSGLDHSLGFRSRDVIVVTLGVPGSYDSLRTAAFTRQLERAASEIPSARIAIADGAPMFRIRGTRFRLPGDPPDRTRTANLLEATPEFLPVLGMRMAAGRWFDPSDAGDVAVVNESLARDLWPGVSAVGQTIVEGGQRRVVGVIADAEMNRVGRVDETMFVPLRAGFAPFALIASPPAGVVQTLGAAAARIDPRVHLDVDSIAGGVARQLDGLRSLAALAALMGLIAVTIAAVGVFGVFTFVVQRRTREIGIRTALGAPARQVVALVVRDGAKSVVWGAAIGLGLAMAWGRIIASELYAAPSVDVAALAGAAAVLVVAGTLSTYLPARRATRVDPMTALRLD